MPGRFELVAEQPLFYLDGAHNEASVTSLVETLKTLFPNRKFHFVVGMMRDKNYKKMLEKVYPFAKNFLLISPNPERGFNTDEVEILIQKQGIDVKTMNDSKEIIAYIQQEIPADDIVIQFGSLHLVGALKTALAKFPI